MVPWVQLCWGQAVCHLPPPIFPVLVPATAEHPRGWKGDAIRRVWALTRGAHPGAVYIDGDSAIEPPAVAAMERAIRSDPGSVWTAAVRIWIPSHPGTDCDVSALTSEQLADLRDVVAMNPDARWTGEATYRAERRPRGVYAHRVWVPEEGRMRWGRPDDDRVELFGLGCTYLPNALCERVEAMGLWDAIEFPRDDRHLSMIAWGVAPRIPARLAPGCEVAHLHWDLGAVQELLGEADRGDGPDGD